MARIRAASLVRSLDQLLGLARLLQAHGPVPGDVEMRVEGVALEHHGDAAPGRRQVVDDLPADADVPRGLGLEPGDDPQQGGLAAAGSAEQHDEFAIGDVEVDALQHVGLAEGLADLVDLELGP